MTEEELKDLSPDCKWLHTCASLMDEEDPIILYLEKDQSSFDDTPFVIIGWSDIGEFLGGDMLNIALFYVNMR